MDIDSDDYHDFVFAGGHLVGEFEQMYRKSREAPWRQDRVNEEPDVPLLEALVSVHAPYGTLLDVGCGLGFLANRLSRYAARVFGIDISPTALEHLTERFPAIRAEVADLMKPLSPPFTDVRSFDAVICRGFFWYVFPALGQVVENLAALTTPGGHLVVHQNFPSLDAAFVGKEVLPTPEHLLQPFQSSGAFTLVARNRFTDASRAGGNDDWSTFVLRRR